MQEKPELPESSTPEVITRHILVTAVWFIKVRWMAVGGLLTGGILAILLGYHLSLTGLAGITLYLTLANLAYIRYARRFQGPPIDQRKLFVFVNLQILTDWLAVLGLVYLTGGVCSPCSPFFVFHVLLASMMLPVRHILTQATLTLVLVALLYLAEALAWVPHHVFIPMIPPLMHQQVSFILAGYSVLAVVIFVSTWLGNQVSRLLHRRMIQLATTKDLLGEANRKMEAIFEVMRQLAGNQELEVLLETIAERAIRLWGIQASVILLVDPKTNSLNFAATCGLGNGIRPDQYNPRWSSRVEELIQARDIIFKPDLSEYITRDDHPVFQWLASEHLKSLMIVPLKVADKTIGGFCLASFLPARFTGDDAKYFKLFADLASIQIEMVRNNQLLLKHGRARSLFFSRVAHDLRAPLAAVCSLLSVIGEGYVHDLDRAKELVNRATRRVQGLTDMVNDLLLLARDSMDMLDPDLQQVDVRTVLQSVIQLHEVEAENKRLALGLDIHGESFPVKATQSGIERIFSNLISNAIKYTFPGGQVAMDLKDVEQRYILFRITDTGIGIPPDAQKHIFEEFYRAPNAKKLDEIGTGLGLSITRRFIENFGGRIMFESTQGKGSTFTFFLPFLGARPGATLAILRDLQWELD